VLDFVAAAFELSGGWLVGSKKKFGFVLYLICNILWIIVAITSEVYGLLLVVIPAFGINIRNYYRWTKRPPK